MFYLLRFVCVRLCVCALTDPKTASIWPGEIKEQISLQITAAQRRAMAPVWLSPPAMTPQQNNQADGGSDVTLCPGSPDTAPCSCAGWTEVEHLWCLFILS